MVTRSQSSLTRYGAGKPTVDIPSPQELQIARAIGRASIPEAAAALFISRKTVEADLARLVGF